VVHFRRRAGDFAGTYWPFPNPTTVCHYKTDTFLLQSQTLSVARSARLLATLCASLVPDPQRLTQTQFLAATPSATHVCVRTCAPGSFVALVRKGFKLTRERYLGTPEGWIPLKELRPVERAVVRGVAYRGAVPPPTEYPDMGGTPPCCWVLLELVDPAAMVPGKRRKGPFPFTTFRRLITSLTTLIKRKYTTYITHHKCTVCGIQVTNITTD
jgi:hypothetical protein